MSGIIAGMRFWMLATMLGVPLPFGQQPASQPVFSVGTTLVQVDAEVTDSKQRHVTNLKAEDFEVVLDHKLQPITNLTYVHLDGAEVNGLASTPDSGRSVAASFVTRPEYVRRSIVIVVDGLGLSFASVEYVRQALRHFIRDQMQPGDLVALWETGRGNSVFQQLTSDKHTLEAGVEALRWNPRSLLDPIPSGREAAARFSGPGETRDATARLWTQDERDERAYQSASLVSGTLNTLSELIEELRTVGGRKAVVLFADGLNLPTVNLGMNATWSPGDQQVIDAFRSLIDNANRSGTVIYTIDPRGLSFVDPGMSLALMASQEDLVSLAERTGGFGTVNSNTFSDALQSIEDDQKGYYLIGFKAPPGIKDTPRAKKFDFHTIKVRVKRPGLHIRSRAGFWGETDAAARPKYDTPQAQMRLAVLSLFNRSDIHVRLTPCYTRTADSQAAVHNFIYIDARDITFKTDSAGRHNASVDLMIIPSVSAGESPPPVTRRVEISASDEQLKKLLESGIVLTMNVALKHAGPYQIRASVRDAAAGAIGSAGQYIEIPDLKRQHLALSTPLLNAETAVDSGGDLEAVSPATREFRAGSKVSFLSVVETDRDESAKLPAGSLDAGVRVYRDGQPIMSTKVPVIEVQGQRVHAVKGEMRLKDAITPGQYYLEVTALDHSGKVPRHASTWIDFQVLP